MERTRRNRTPGLQKALLACACLLVLVSGGTSAASEADIEELRGLLAEQQALIGKLLENQQSQAAEIESLKQQLQGQPQVVGSTEDSEVDASYEVKPEPEPEPQQAHAELAAASPVKVLPGDARFSVGGHLNRALNYADDGNSTEAYHVDGGSVPSLTYIKAHLPVNDHLSLGSHIEYALQHNSANAVSQDVQTPGFSTSARNFELTLDSSRWGKLWFGRGLMASFVAVDLDKSQTWRYNIASPGNTFGGLKFVDSRDDSLSDLTVASVFLDAEAFNRKDRVRYDSPAFAGFRLSGSAGTADSTAFALRWNGQLGELDLTAAITTQNNPIEGRVSDRVDGGIALYHAGTGLSFTVGAAEQDYKRSFYQNFGRSDGDNSGYGVKLGWRRNWFSLGETRMALDYFRSEDVLYKRDDSESMGLFISQQIDDWSVEPYFGYRYYDYDTGPNANGLAVEDIYVWTMGARMALDLTIQ